MDLSDERSTKADLGSRLRALLLVLFHRACVDGRGTERRLVSLACPYSYAARLCLFVGNKAGRNAPCDRRLRRLSKSSRKEDARW